MLADNWYIVDKERLNKEIKEVKKYYPDFELKKNNCTLFWIGEVSTGNERYKMKIVYPSLYPYIRPKLYVLTDDEQILMSFQTSHQLHDGSICLFTYDNGPSGWKWDYTIKDVIDRFYQFLEDRGNKDVEIKHSSFFSRFYGKKETNIIILVPLEFKGFMNKHKYGTFFMRKVDNAGKFFVVTELSNGRQTESILGTKIWEKVYFVNNPICGSWCNINRPSPTFNYLKTNKSLLNMVEKKTGRKLNFDEKLFLLISYKYGRDTSLICYFLDKKIKNFPASIPIYIDAEFADIYNDTFKRTRKVIREGVDLLQNKKVIGVGLGSIGSSIMLELSKSSIGNFVLYDPDIVELSNLSKHACDLRYIGMRKVDAVRDLIWQRNVLASIEAHNSSPLNEQVVERFIEHIKQDNAIVVISIAEHECEGALNRLLVKYNCPAIYVSALDSAQYGRIFRVLPNKTPCYECISIWNEIEPEKFPSLVNVEQREQDSLGEFYAYRNPGFPGISVDVGFISMLATRMTIQTLLRNSSASELYPDSKYHHIIWSNRQGWIFDEPLQIRTLNYPIATDCPVCGK